MLTGRPPTFVFILVLPSGCTDLNVKKKSLFFCITKKTHWWSVSLLQFLGTMFWDCNLYFQALLKQEKFENMFWAFLKKWWWSHFGTVYFSFQEEQKLKQFLLLCKMSGSKVNSRDRKRRVCGLISWIYTDFPWGNIGPWLPGLKRLRVRNLSRRVFLCLALLLEMSGIFLLISKSLLWFLHLEI